MPIRNPFASKRPPVVNGWADTNDENAKPSSGNGNEEKPDYASSRASSVLSIKSRREEPTEYKLSGVSHSDVSGRPEYS